MNIKIITAIISAIALSSCSFEVPLPSGATAKTTVGWYTPSSPGDPGAELGAFTKRVPKEINREK